MVIMVTERGANSTTVYVASANQNVELISVQSYDASRSYEEQSSQSDSHARQYDWSHQDRGQEDRSRGGTGAFGKKRLVPSEPSPHVIFLGLDPDFTEADVCRLPCS